MQNLWGFCLSCVEKRRPWKSLINFCLSVEILKAGGFTEKFNASNVHIVNEEDFRFYADEEDSLTKLETLQNTTETVNSFF